MQLTFGVRQIQSTEWQRKDSLGTRATHTDTLPSLLSANQRRREPNVDRESTSGLCPLTILALSLQLDQTAIKRSTEMITLGCENQKLHMTKWQNIHNHVLFRKMWCYNNTLYNITYFCWLGKVKCELLLATAQPRYRWPLPICDEEIVVVTQLRCHQGSTGGRDLPTITIHKTTQLYLALI